MRTHILLALMTLFLGACASHHRDVASVQSDQEATEAATGQAQHAVLDGVSSRGDHIR